MLKRIIGVGAIALAACGRVESDPASADTDASSASGGASAGGAPATGGASGNAGMPAAGGVGNVGGGAPGDPCPGPANSETVMAEWPVNVNPPRAVAVDSKNLYWWDADEERINAVPLDACGSSPPHVIATNQKLNDTVPGAAGLASDGINVYWALNVTPGKEARIVFCPIAGCVATPPETFGPLFGVVGGIALDGTSLYAIVGHLPDTSWHELVSCPKTGCDSPETLADATAAVGPALDASNLFWLVIGSGPILSNVYKCEKSQCADPSVFGTLVVKPYSLNVDQQYLYLGDVSIDKTSGSTVKYFKDNVAAVDAFALYAVTVVSIDPSAPLYRIVRTHK